MPVLFRQPPSLWHFRREIQIHKTCLMKQKANHRNKFRQLTGLELYPICDIQQVSPACLKSCIKQRSETYSLPYKGIELNGNILGMRQFAAAFASLYTIVTKASAS